MDTTEPPRALTIDEDKDGLTNWYVLHAEANAIMKVAASTQSCAGATLTLLYLPAAMQWRFTNLGLFAWSMVKPIKTRQV